MAAAFLGAKLLKAEAEEARRAKAVANFMIVVVGWRFKSFVGWNYDSLVLQKEMHPSSEVGA